MKNRAPQETSSRLIDHLCVPPEYGALHGVLATSFEAIADFLELDFLPSVLGLGAWDDKKWTSRIAMERALAHTKAVSVLMDGRRFRGRPRSLRVELLPTTGRRGQVLHAKVVLLVYESAVRLLVGSANLTEPGYRLNREVAISLSALETRPAEGALILSALERIEERLGPWWSPGASAVVELARSQISQWPSQANEDESFVWGGGEWEEPLWKQFLRRWPREELVKSITVVSPFWSEDSGGGPLSQLLAELSSRELLAPGAQIGLVASPTPDTQTSYRPVLPPTYRDLSVAKWGATLVACTADPRVTEEEGGSGVTRERPLHAKVVLLEGKKTTLAYAGSANFSAPGWGFLHDPAVSNIEAGIVIRATGRGRKSLNALVPPLTGPGIPMGEISTADGAVDAQEPPPAPWPSFLRSARLGTDGADRDRLRLLVTVFPDRVRGSWSLALAADGPDVVALEPGAASDAEVSLRLDGDQVQHLLSKQCVWARWWEHDLSIEFPLNVSAAARDRLPFAPNAAAPGEHSLLAYYQGKISWEELFPMPPEETENEDSVTTLVNDESQVDTSKIQSYQVREFVRALRGIRDDLAQAVVSEPAMRIALLGPVSPCALAQEIASACLSGRRTPTAAGFQLLEILGCLADAGSFPVIPVLREEWARLLGDAAGRVEKHLQSLRAAQPSAFADESFAAYERMIRSREPGETAR